MRREVEALLGRPLEQPLERPEGLPEHPVATGAPFHLAGSAAPAELERYYAGADRLLRGLRELNPGASPVRCWPHHFDLATLILLDPDADAETARSIGVGLSPGDAARPEPYFYVLPWPRPTGDLPALDGGAWNTGGWAGRRAGGRGFHRGGLERRATRADRTLSEFGGRTPAGELLAS